MTTYIILPTYLYIKQHSITGLKYFGKTTKDPLKYNGSGVHWTRHIKQHGKEHIITTWVSEPYIDSIAISEFALSFSRDNNIVESKDWANLINENGLDGGGNKGVSGIPQSAESRKKRSDANRGKPSPKKGIPSGRKGIPSPLKGKPSGKKGIPTGLIPWNKDIPSGKKGIPTGSHPKVKCPHCCKIVGIRTKTRYHFDNCKKKNYLTGTNKIALSLSLLP